MIYGKVQWRGQCKKAGHETELSFFLQTASQRPGDLYILTSAFAGLGAELRATGSGAVATGHDN